MKKKLGKVTRRSISLLLAVILAVSGIVYVTNASENASFGLYSNASLATAIGGKTYTWCKNSDESKVLNANDGKIYNGNVDTRSDKNYRFNIKECNSTDNNYYMTYGYPEINLVNYSKGNISGREMILSKPIDVKYFSTFTFEIGMKVNKTTYNHGNNKDFGCKVYFYGADSSGNYTSVEAKSIKYGVGFYTTAIVDLAPTNLTKIERVGFEFDYNTEGNEDYTNLSESSAGTKTMLANFRFNEIEAQKTELTLKANDLDVLFYNGAVMGGVLENKASTPIFWTNGAPAAFGVPPVDNADYKYITTRISIGSYVVYDFEKPIKATDYKDLTLQLLAWSQGADEQQGYLKETATEFTYTILPYDAKTNEGGLEFKVAAKTWTDCVIPLEKIADEDGYVSKFIILYSANNADGHTVDDQSKYTINFALHDSKLGEVKEDSKEEDKEEEKEEQIPLGTQDKTFGLYVKEELATQTAGKTYTWSNLANSKVKNKAGSKINKVDKMDTRSDNNYKFNVRECNSKDNPYYVAFGFPEINLINYQEDTTKGCEMVFSEAVKVENFSTFTFEIGMRIADDAKQERRGGNKDFKCNVYAYGSNGKQKVSVPVKEVSYGLDFYTTVVVELEKTGLEYIERIAFELPFDSTNKDGYPELTTNDKVILANFKFNNEIEKKSELTLKANDLDVLFYNGAAMGGVLENKASTPILWTNGAAAAFGVPPVDNADYKYMTTRISTGSYMVYMFKQPIKAADYKDLTLQLLAWPQGADKDQGYLKETATEFTYTILPYNAKANEGGLEFKLAAKTWTDCVIPLEKFADEDGYVSKFIILYSANDADGRKAEDQSKYSINFALHDSKLGEVKEVEEQPVPIGTQDKTFGLYVKEELATQTAGRTYTWSTLANSKVTNKVGSKINKVDKMDTRSDNNYKFNVRECNSKDNPYYVAFGFPEINLINYQEDTTKGCEMVFSEAVKVENFSTFTFEIGMRIADDAKQERRGGNKDFKCNVYAYGSNGKEKVSVPVKEVAYGLDFYTTVVIELEKTGLEYIERIAFELPFDSTNSNGYPELTGKDKVILANFKFNNAIEKKSELSLKANDLGVLFYNGAAMGGVLENKASTPILWTNGASAAFGLAPVDNADYKYMTTRISTGSYMVYMFKEPVNIKDYHNLTLKLLAWPQGADKDQGYLKETATEFTYKILPYDAAENSGGLELSLSAKQWTDCKIPLEMFADENGYVSKFIVLYDGNNAQGHTVDDQSKYTINFALHDSVLDNIDQTEMVFTYVEKPEITKSKISFRLKSTTMFGAGDALTDSLAESISVNGKTLKNLISQKKAEVKLKGNYIVVVLNKSEFKFDNTDCIEIKKGATVKTYKNGQKLINTDDEKFIYSSALDRFEVAVDWERVNSNSKRGVIEQVELAPDAESDFNGETLKMSSIWIHFKDGAKKNYDTFSVHSDLQEFAKLSSCSDLLAYHYAQNGVFESVMDKLFINGKSLRDWLIEDEQAGNSGMIRVQYLPFNISQGKILRVLVSEKSLLKIGEGVAQSVELKEGFTNPSLQQISDNTYFEIDAKEAIANAKLSNINLNDVEVQNVDLAIKQDNAKESVSWFAKYGIAVIISGVALIAVIGGVAFWTFRKKRGGC